MLDTPLMLWELSMTEQRYRAVLEAVAGVPVTEVADRYEVSIQNTLQPIASLTAIRCSQGFRRPMIRG
jgi:hypothetical protein